MNDRLAIGSIPLYTHLDRIDRGLATLGIGPTDPIQPEQLFPLDQWHYHGTEAIRAAADQLGLGPSSRVLEVGSGIGGPARYLAHTTGCHVTALELQPKVHEVAADLTQRCGLGDRVHHVNGDALSHIFPDATFDAVVSWLAVLHIPDRKRLYQRLARTLRPGGGCYIEDLCMCAPFAPQDQQDLHNVVFGVSVTSIDAHVDDLQAAGFINVTATDETADWAPYTHARLATWRANHATHAAAQGEAAYAAQELFYAVIARLFASGSLGGVRLVAYVAK
jgi:cyclopropane fatty-acyl-phospholipid synthase-like methyltransferase